MAWVRKVPPEEAKGELKRQYDAATRRAGKIFEILQVQSLTPQMLGDGMRLYLSSMFAGPLSRRRCEMLAVVVSRTNHCVY